MLDREPCEKALERLNKNRSARKVRERFMVEEGERLEKYRKRQIPYDIPNKLPSILKFTKVKHRQLAILFDCGRFPQVPISAMLDKFGDKARHNVDMLDANLSTYQLELQEAVDAEKAMGSAVL